MLCEGELIEYLSVKNKKSKRVKTRPVVFIVQASFFTLSNIICFQKKAQLYDSLVRHQQLFCKNFICNWLYFNKIQSIGEV